MQFQKYLEIFLSSKHHLYQGKSREISLSEEKKKQKQQSKPESSCVTVIYSHDFF